jgi:class 3 adenylate cyclase
MEFTVIGDAVNIAWRLQERTKHGPTILLGESVAALLGDKFSTEDCGELHLPDHEPVGYHGLLEEKERHGSAPLSAGILGNHQARIVVPCGH